MAKPHIKTWLGLVISLASMAYVLRELDFSHLWQMIRQVNPLYVVAINALYAISLILRTKRWQGLMRPVKDDPRFGALFSANLIGFMANNVLPARVGELVRAWTGARLAQVRLSATVATILVERMLDVPVLLGFLLFMLYFIDPRGKAEGLGVEHLHAVGGSLLVGYVVALAVMAAMVRWPHKTTALLAAMMGRISGKLAQRVERLLASFTKGLATMGQGRVLAGMLALSVLVRLPIFAMHYVFLPALGLPQTLFMAAMAALGHGLALTIPAGPGYIGTYQLGVFWALSLAGAPREEALAYGVIFWAAQYFPLVSAGLFETYRHGLAISSLRRHGEELDARDENGCS